MTLYSNNSCNFSSLLLKHSRHRTTLIHNRHNNYNNNNWTHNKQKLLFSANNTSYVSNSAFCAATNSTKTQTCNALSKLRSVTSQLRIRHKHTHKHLLNRTLYNTNNNSSSNRTNRVKQCRLRQF